MDEDTLFIGGWMLILGSIGVASATGYLTGNAGYGWLVLGLIGVVGGSLLLWVASRN